MTSPIKAARRRSRRTHSFTLVEVLLVVAIIGIVTVISMPYLVHSIRGNRLRTAARTVVMLGRYSRSMALLRQKPVELSFDCSAASVRAEVVARPVPAAGPDLSEMKKTRAGESVPAEDGVAPGPAPLSGGSTPMNVARTLDGVRIASVAVEDRDRVSEGAVSVIYQSNGRCDPYTVRLEDDRNKNVTVEVDALGTAITRSGE